MAQLFHISQGSAAGILEIEQNQQSINQRFEFPFTTYTEVVHDASVDNFTFIGHGGYINNFDIQLLNHIINDELPLSYMDSPPTPYASTTAPPNVLCIDLPPAASLPVQDSHSWNASHNPSDLPNLIAPIIDQPPMDSGSTQTLIPGSRTLILESQTLDLTTNEQARETTPASGATPANSWGSFEHPSPADVSSFPRSPRDNSLFESSANNQYVSEEIHIIVETTDTGLHDGYPCSLFESSADNQCGSGEISIIVETTNAGLHDGYTWRKYGEKKIKDHEYTRSYYRCAEKGCTIKKQTQRHAKNQFMFTYFGKHNHRC